LRANANYANLEDSSTWVTVGGDYYFMPNLSAGIEADLASDYSSVSIGAGYYFK
jgi:hypothetical protein